MEAPKEAGLFRLRDRFFLLSRGGETPLLRSPLLKRFPLPLGEGQGEGLFSPIMERGVSTVRCISLSIWERRRRRDQVFPSRREMGRDRGDMLLAKVW